MILRDTALGYILGLPIIDPSVRENENENEVFFSPNFVEQAQFLFSVGCFKTWFLKHQGGVSLVTSLLREIKSAVIYRLLTLFTVL